MHSQTTCEQEKGVNDVTCPPTARGREPGRALYFDNNATTPILPSVRAAMCEAMETFGNPSSVHFCGEAAAGLIDRARVSTAALLRCDPEQVVFNSGGSEGASSVIVGTGLAHLRDGGHVITSAVEHPAVLRACGFVRELGFELSVLPVDGAGRVDPGTLQKALRPDTRLVSIMHANNETGALQPLDALSRAAREAGVPFHCDAVQTAGKERIGLVEGFLTISAHKFHGPKGVGVTTVRTDAPLQKLVFGGDQEHDRRAGTENVLGIVGLGAAADAASVRLDDPKEQIRRGEIGGRLRAGLASIDGAVVNSPAEGCLPETVNVSFEGLRADTIVDVLSARGVAASSGSACHSAHPEPSHVLLAMGLSAERALGAVRFSCSCLTTRDEVDEAVAISGETVRQLHAMWRSVGTA
jgi:cysteine desulfurase